MSNATFEVILASIEMYIVRDTLLIRMSIKTSLAPHLVTITLHYPNITPILAVKRYNQWDRIRKGVDDIGIELRKIIEHTTIYILEHPTVDDIDSIKPYRLN